MKIIRTVLGGLAAALIASSAQAGRLDILYWGDDNAPTLVIDGSSFILSTGEVNLKSIYAGDHSIVLYYSGTSWSGTFNLSSSNTAGGETWCMSLDDKGWELLSEDDCDEMYFWAYDY